MAKMLRAELEEIWQWLEKQLTPKDIELLAEHRPVTWQRYLEKSYMQAWDIRTVYALSYRIQDVLDAKNGRIEINYEFAGGLPKRYLIEIAGMLNLNISEKRPNWFFINEILKEIRKQRQAK